MDIVDFGFHALQQFLAGASTVTGVVFKWSDKHSRMVLHIDGKPLYHDEGGSSLLDVTRDLEGKDVTALIQKLVDLNETRKRTLMKRFSKADANMHIIADILSQKLHGPRPEPNSVPYTFRVDPSSLKVEKLIASGGYGCVTKSKWLGRTVSEKKVKVPGLSRKQFEMEAAILATVQHPRVVRMIGCAFEKKEKTGSLVMELMEGDLPHAIEKRCPSRARGVSPFPLRVAIDITLQLGEGMQYLREHNILHRDLKGKNVLLNRCRTSECGLYRKFPDLASLLHTEEYYIVKLADFGIAKARRGQTDFRTMMAGTTFWRAPEVFKIPDVKTAQNYEWPADVYSFAMTCYEILTGCNPFDEVLASELYERIVAGDRPPLDDVKIPPLLKNLVERCWKTNPNERPNFNEICKTLWQCKVENILPAFRLQIGLSQTENVAVKADVECSRASDPANSCSQYGYWGRRQVYCGREAGPCTGGGGGGGGGGTPPSPVAGGLGAILTRNLYEDLFPGHLAFYSYDALIEAARMFPQFGTAGDVNTRKREIAAYAAHVSFETAGLRIITEVGTDFPCCDSSQPEFPCGDKQFKGRGPLQLTWNYNYGTAGNYLHEPLLQNPELVATNPVISFKTSLWVWHQFGGNGIPHMHDVITGEWRPNRADRAANRVPGFGVTILILNGGLECNRESPQANSRVKKFIEFCGLLNVSPGANLDCKRIKPF